MKIKFYNTIMLKSAWMTLVLAVLLSMNSVRAQWLEAGTKPTKDESSIHLSFWEVGNLKFRIEITSPLLILHDAVSVFIVNKDRQILYANTYSHHALRVTTFDLSTLQDGTYGFEVRSGDKRVTQLFAIKTQAKRVILARNY